MSLRFIFLADGVAHPKRSDAAFGANLNGINVAAIAVTIIGVTLFGVEWRDKLATFFCGDGLQLTVVLLSLTIAFTVMSLRIIDVTVLFLLLHFVRGVLIFSVLIRTLTHC